MPQSPRSSECSWYKYKALSKEDIRIIRLQPGRHSQDLYAEIAHVRLKLPASSTQDTIPNSAIDRTLPSGWRSFRTPEGQLLYSNTSVTLSACQYHHPSPDSVPDELLAILKSETQNDSFELVVDQKDRFEALSYVWGDTTLQDVLYITELRPSAAASKVPITANLSSALRHLRDALEPRLLWVDAICINQNDHDEKGRQVLRISDIFRSAWRVVAWLGEASFDSPLAIETLQYLGEQIEVTQTGWYFSSPDAVEKEWINSSLKLPYSIEQWEALTSLMNRSWFKRLWVLQEIALANPSAIVQCGCDTVAYSLFRRAATGLRKRSHAPDSLLERIEQKFILSYGVQNTGIFDLLLMARGHACSLPHDKIYGLLGIMGPRLRGLIRPSYRMPFFQVFKEVFLAHSTLTGRLELLAHCIRTVDADTPSWVPDWRSHRWNSSYTDYTTLATGMSKASFREVRSGELNVSGIVHGAVISTFRIFDSSKGDHIGPWLRELSIGCITSATYPTGEDMRQAFARLLCRNHLAERFPGVDYFNTLKQWQDTLNLLIDSKGSEPLDSSDVEHSIRGDWECGKFFRTENGHLGSGSIFMAEGDEVCFLLGLFCPIIIRPVGHGQFKVIGGCYLHGLMDSEALLGRLPDCYTVQHHRIRGRSMLRYYNSNTGDLTAEDPRLVPLNGYWHRVEPETNADDPQNVDFFRNTQTGELINYDPRLTKTALEQRGVNLQDITLV